MSSRVKTAVALGVFTASFGLLYWQTIVQLVRDWIGDDYSHGFLIVPLAAYFAWERRSRLSAAPLRPSYLGLVIVIASLVMHAGGVLGAEPVLSRLSILATIAGGVVFLFGWKQLRTLAFAIAFLLLMIPIPKIIFYQITFPLQLLASRFGEVALSAAHIPVLREGNVIVLARTTLEVAEACSGIRSLMSLFTVAIIYGYFTDSRPIARAALAASAIPIAVAANGFRVAGTGVAAHYLGSAAAKGFFHTFSGWLVFTTAVVMLCTVQRVIMWAVPNRTAVGR